jgi:hypothetical protein
VLQFILYNLTIYFVNFFGKNSTLYFNSLKQDPTVESQTKEFKFKFMHFVLEVVVLEYSFLNHSQQILGLIPTSLTTPSISQVLTIS